VSDPVGLITELVAAAGPGLAAEQIRAVVTAVAGGRAKSRRLAAALASRPAVLADGRSPAPRAVGDLLLALRQAGAQSVSPPRCARCGKPLRTFRRRGQDWYCAPCGQRAEPCAGCGTARPVASRDRAGQPRCFTCPDTDGRDPVTVIFGIITGLDPAASQDAVAAAVRRSAPRPSYQQKLAWALEDNPRLLTGEAHLAPLRSVLRLVDALHAAGVAGITRPACPGCHRVVRIDTPLNGVRVCRTCLARSRAQQCARCGAHREPVTRDEQGRPLCAHCFISDPANLETCTGCGRRRRVHWRTPHGPLCSSCPTLPLLTCSVCGQITPCGISRATGLPWCPACQRRTAACSACGRVAPVTSGTLAGPLCAACTPPPAWASCPVCSDPGHPSPGQCARCLIRRRLDELMGPAAASLPPGLQALRREITAAEHPGTAMLWLTNPSITPVLAGLAAGRIPLTHQGLDGLPQTRALAHLRQTLVAIGALHGRDEEMTRLEAFLAALIESQPGTERRQLLHRYLTWHLIRRLRSRNDGQPATRQQARKIRRLARGAVAFLDWLDAHDLTLGSCQQPDLDRWLTDEHAGYREEAGRLIRWARASNLTTGHLTAVAWTGPAQLTDHQHRWAAARRLLHDAAIRPEDRLAGLLVLLYAQGATAISQMTAAQIQASDDSVRLHLGRVPIHLPEPAATIARTVLANRKGQAAIGARQPSPWLFPGGQPGRPISADGLTRRLNALGIRPGQDRSTALFQLAAEIPAAILASTLDISTKAAVTWQRHAAGDWITYAADISHRPES
jgi:uncharacterized protein YidB (DUF937 family)